MAMLYQLRKKLKNVSLMNTEQCIDLVDDLINQQ